MIFSNIKLGLIASFFALLLVLSSTAALASPYLKSASGGAVKDPFGQCSVSPGGGTPEGCGG